MKTFFTFFCCLAGLSLAASPVIFRGGELLRAELSTVQPEIASFDAALFPDLPERRIYAALTLDLPAGRDISIFDYKLVVFGHEYPCVALRSGNTSWRTTSETLKNQRRVSLLFILNRGMIGLDKETKITLKTTASATIPDNASWKVAFRNIGDQSFTR